MLIKLQESKTFHYRMIYKQMKKKYLEKDIYISPELRDKIIDNLTLKVENYWQSKINIIV